MRDTVGSGLKNGTNNDGTRGHPYDFSSAQRVPDEETDCAEIRICCWERNEIHKIEEVAY